MSSKNNYVVFDGSIGVGKSYLINKLHNLLSAETLSQLCFVQEPVDKYSTFKSKYNPLQLSNESPFEYSGWCQLHIINTLESSFKAIENSNTIVAERGIHSCRVFNATNHAMVYYDEFVYDFLESKIDDALKRCKLDETGPNKTILVEASVDCCVQRIIFRNRGEEKKLRFMGGYLRELQNQYCAFGEILEESGHKVFRIQNNVEPTEATLQAMVDYILE